MKSPFLKSLHSSDIEDLSQYTPENPNNFSISIQALIGEQQEGGEESFEFLVCTPTWIEEQLAGVQKIWGKDMLIVREYDYALIEESIISLCNQCGTRESWNEVGIYLGRYTTWEFEGYQQ